MANPAAPERNPWRYYPSSRSYTWSGTISEHSYDDLWDFFNDDYDYVAATPTHVWRPFVGVPLKLLEHDRQIRNDGRKVEPPCDFPSVVEPKLS